MRNKIGIILLAAGASIRYGNFPKQLLKINDQTLIEIAVKNALASRANLVCVVLGANYQVVNDEIEQFNVESVFNEKWNEGMSSSIKCGLRKLFTIEPNLSAIIIQLCDQPLINYEIIDNLIHQYQQTDKKIIASKYNQTFGVPALFDKYFFDEILELNNEIGAKKLIANHKSETEFIDVPQANLDIDTIEDYEKFIKIKLN